MSEFAETAKENTGSTGTAGAQALGKPIPRRKPMPPALERLVNGLIKENPTFVLTLGMCPTLAVTTSAVNGLGMGLTTAAVLALSNLMISALRKIIPNRVRIPAFIVIVASFVTVVQLLLEAYLPALNASLGIYIPLIVVNCIILGRAESYAYHNPPVPSLFDGIGMGLGFTAALTLIGMVRELLGSGAVFGREIIPEAYHIGIFVLAPGAFFVLALLTAAQNAVKNRLAAKGIDVSKIGSGCGSDCAGCAQAGSCSAVQGVSGERSKQPKARGKAAEKVEEEGKKGEGKKEEGKKKEGQKEEREKEKSKKEEGQREEDQREKDQREKDQGEEGLKENKADFEKKPEKEGGDE